MKSERPPSFWGCMIPALCFWRPGIYYAHIVPENNKLWKNTPLDVAPLALIESPCFSFSCCISSVKSTQRAVECQGPEVAHGSTPWWQPEFCWCFPCFLQLFSCSPCRLERLRFFSPGAVSVALDQVWNRGACSSERGAQKVVPIRLTYLRRSMPRVSKTTKGSFAQGSHILMLKANKSLDPPMYLY